MILPAGLNTERYFRQRNNNKTIFSIPSTYVSTVWELFRIFNLDSNNNEFIYHQLLITLHAKSIYKSCYKNLLTKPVYSKYSRNDELFISGFKILTLKINEIG